VAMRPAHSPHAANWRACESIFKLQCIGVVV